MELTTLKDLQEKAKKTFLWKEINSDNFYEFINTETYLWKMDLLNCIKEIDYNLQIDNWYLYWDDNIDYLTCVVASYLDKYIRENYKNRNCDFVVDDD